MAERDPEVEAMADALSRSRAYIDVRPGGAALGRLDDDEAEDLRSVARTARDALDGFRAGRGPGAAELLRRIDAALPLAEALHERSRYAAAREIVDVLRGGSGE